MKFITFLTTTLLAILTLSPEAFAQSNPPKCPPGEIALSSLNCAVIPYVRQIVDRDHNDCLSKLEILSTTKIETETYHLFDKEKFRSDMKSAGELIKSRKCRPSYDDLNKFPNLIVIGRNLLGLGMHTINKELVLRNIAILEPVAFIEAPARKVSFPNVKIIGKEAFYNADGLEEIDIPNVIMLGEEALEDTGISHISLPHASVINRKALRTKTLTKLELTTPEEIILGDNIVANSEKIDLVLNKNKSPNGNSSPKATDATHWAGYEWKSITYK